MQYSAQHALSKGDAIAVAWRPGCPHNSIVAAVLTELIALPKELYHARAQLGPPAGRHYLQYRYRLIHENATACISDGGPIENEPTSLEYFHVDRLPSRRSGRLNAPAFQDLVRLSKPAAHDVGRVLTVQWPDGLWYEGTLHDYDPRRDRPNLRGDDGAFCVRYHDGDEEWENLGPVRRYRWLT